MQDNDEQYKRPPDKENERAAEITDKTQLVSNRPTPLNTTIYNSDKDLWGWNSGGYIVLKWNPKDYSRFRIYRKTNKSSEWKPAWPESITRSEFFDREIQGISKIEYKVEATNIEGQVLYTYKTLIFILEN